MIFGIFLAVLTAGPQATPLPPVIDGRIQTRVSTIAGDGVAGLRDGPARNAQFLEPFSVALDKAGALYIVDRAAQRIRLLYKGTVSTIAGSGSLDGSAQHVIGGYKDGPALTASFNEPTGITIGPDGAAYVADSGNHCIRKIVNGYVSTFSGSPKRVTAVDGDASVAGFDSPRTLSFDGDGNLFVADYQVGVREISPTGVVTTVPIYGGPKEITGLSVFGHGNTFRLAVADNQQLLVYTDLTSPPEMVTRTEGGRLVGNPFAVAALNQYEYVVADVTNSIVELFRAPLKPFVSNWYATELAGMGRASETLSAGFSDGPTYSAQLDFPTGVVVSPTGTTFIADSGNRRIRAAQLPDMRMPVGNRIEVFSQVSNRYKICFVASSQAHYTHWWQDSTAGQIELNLRSNWKNLGFPEQPELFSARIDGGNAANQSLWDWAEQVPGQGLVNMVVLSLFSGDAPPVGPDGNPYTAITKRLIVLKDNLAKNDVRLFVTIYPAGVEVSPVEAIRFRDFRSSHTDDYMRFDDFRSREEQYVQAVKASGVPYYSAYTDFVNYEKGPRLAPLYGIIDSHFTEFGSAFYGRLIERSMEIQKPWLDGAK